MLEALHLLPNAVAGFFQYLFGGYIAELQAAPQQAAMFVLPVVAIAMALAFPALRTARFDLARGMLLSLAMFVALAGGMCYWSSSWWSNRYLNSYEFFHYYVGAKYWKELGYTDLYKATNVALAEAGRKDLAPNVRDLKANKVVRTTEVLQQAAEEKAKFSPARWEEFKKDVSFFRGNFGGPTSWNKLMMDKGYNPPPMWTMIGGTLANWVPTSNYWGMQSLVMIDVLFMTIAAGFVCWVFGPRAMFFMVLVMSTQYVTSHWHMKGAFMRMDWVMGLIVAACCLKKEWWIPAGMLMGWAVCSRVFPAVFGFGLGAKWLLELVLDRRFNRGYFTCLVAMGTTIVVAAALSWLMTGTEYWREFLHKITEHNDEFSAWRIGFKYVWTTWQHGAFAGAGAMQANDQGLTLYHAIQLGVLLISIPLVRKLEPFEALCFGIVPAFFLVAATYYYYIMILVPALFFAAKLDRWPRAVGLTLIFLEGMIAHYGHHVWDRSLQQFFMISCMVMVIVVYMMALSGAKWLEKPAAQPEASTA